MKNDAWHVLPPELQFPYILNLIEISLAEDLSPNVDKDSLGKALSGGDITSTAIMDRARVLTGTITAKGKGIVAGLPLITAIFKYTHGENHVETNILDGQMVEPGQEIAKVTGPGITLLIAERTALNFLGRLSGIATLTRKFVETVANTKAVILDTRKTMPGFRYLDKYAVRQGGGKNHRMGLYDMALIKDNHIKAAGGVEAAILKIHRVYSERIPIEVEVKTIQELEAALQFQVDRIMLDNMDLATMKKAVQVTHGRIPLEASGNVSLETVRSIAETGVDYISVGALTHSAPTLDISMKIFQIG